MSPTLPTADLPASTSPADQPEAWVRTYLRYLQSDAGLDRRQLEADCRKLDALIQQLAQLAAQRLRLNPTQREEFCADAARYFLYDLRLKEKDQPQRIARYGAAGGHPLRRWLYLKLIGRARNYLARKPLGIPLDSLSESVSDHEADAELAQRETFQQLEKILFLWSQEPIPAGVDYFAVFVMIVWLETANPRQLNETASDPDLVLPIRFPVGTANRSFKAGWPVLAAIWRALGCADKPLAGFDAQEFCSLVRAMSGGPTRFERSLWHKWVSVSRQQAEQWWPVGIR